MWAFNMLYRIIRSTVLGLGCLTIAWLSSGGTSIAGEKVSVYKWDPVPGASYYRGRYKYHGADVAFRTDSTWLMLKTVSDITVKAISKEGRLITVIPVSASHLTKGYQQPGEPKDNFIGDLAQGKDFDPLEDDESEPTISFSGQTRKLHPGQLRLSLHLAAGRESLSAQAGVDSYGGNSDIGSTSVAVNWQPANAAWLVYMQGEGHNLATVASGSHKAAKFLRATGKSFLFYELSRGAGKDDSSLGIGAGGIYTQLPVMGITDTNKGTATLRLQSATGPAIAIEAAKNFSERLNILGLLSYQPLSFTPKLKSLSAMADTLLRWQLAQHWTADLTMTWQWYRMNSSATCEIADCQNFSQSTSSLFMVGVGSGIKF